MSKPGDGAAPPERENTLFEFPCDFPVKIMGQATDDFRSLVLGIVTRHFGPLEAGRIEERPSSNGKYLSLTCTVNAISREQLDALYRDLTSHPMVAMVL